jgi:hypothetical protein
VGVGVGVFGCESGRVWVGGGSGCEWRARCFFPAADASSKVRYAVIIVRLS